MAKRTPPERAHGSDASATGSEELAGWQRRALDRSLVDARRCALDKSNGFVRAAIKLLQESGGLQFTVQEVVDRSQLSSRSFDQTFASRDELLLALFEEYIGTAAVWPREQQPHVGIHSPGRPGTRAGSAAGRAARCGRARRDRGKVRDDISSRRLSEILLHTGTAAVHTTILRTGRESPDDVWAFCLGGIRPSV